MLDPAAHPVLRRAPQVDQAAQATQQQRPSQEPAFPSYTTPEGMIRAEFRAMGTTVSILLPAQQATRGLLRFFAGDCLRQFARVLCWVWV